ncbi:MAG: tetratricopeptide repeat-containing sensor histidine kinase [Reichenbachiella sp.]|uniref:ATP-binding protein n=1 Tax=Reichenbachiella sp. TaxID=2184521 RepID=UPI0032634543
MKNQLQSTLFYKLGLDVLIHKIAYACCLSTAGIFLAFTSKAQNQKVADSLELIYEQKQADEFLDLELIENLAFHHTSAHKKHYYSNLIIEISSEQSDPKWLYRGLILRGHSYRLIGNIDLALQDYFQAATLADSIDFKKGIGGANSAIGDVYSVEGQHSKSIQHYRKAALIFKILEDSVNLATVLLNTGELYRKSEELDSALIFFQRSKVIFNRINYPIGTAYNLGNIGIVLASRGQYVQAEDNMNNAISILQELGDRYAIAAYYTELADVYAQQGKSKKALEYARRSLAIGKEEGLKEQIRDASLKLSEFYIAADDSDQAYYFLKQYNAFRDSINNEETIRKMADLRTEYEVAQKQVELDLLGEQARLNRIVSWSAVFIIALLLVLSVTLLKVNRIKGRAVRIVRQRRRVIAAQRNKLDEVNKTKDRFFSIISHDIRGPVSNFQGISGLINILADSKDEEGLKQLGKMMESSAKEVSVLLDNLLEWALSQEGKIPYLPENVSLKELCESNLSIMANLAAAKKINLIGDKIEELTVVADKNSVSTIIRNLLSNAIKFTPEEGQVNLEVTEQDKYGVVIVRDTGIGIPKNKIEDIFSFKGKRSRGGTKGEKGIGLGLSLVHEFVHLNNGRVEVDSEEGVGTTFKVFLPKEPKEEA